MEVCEKRELAKNICSDYNIIWDENVTEPTLNGKPITSSDIINTFIDEDIAPYKKKSKAKPPKKYKHKHTYEPCVVEFPAEWYLKEHIRNREYKSEINSYCTICGKIGGMIDEERWYRDERVYHNIFGSVLKSMPTTECEKELNKDTRTLTTFLLNDPFQKNI